MPNDAKVRPGANGTGATAASSIFHNIFTIMTKQNVVYRKAKGKATGPVQVQASPTAPGADCSWSRRAGLPAGIIGHVTR
ncbi:membrane protein [Anopheles sinensis]|uniref:Membrane protein n=1 Tax=Anopheles sinensis TaxID=74873 RepID=A0A084W924_ANOSI|nr:membrane protein [Anopheles sinensis]